MRQFLWAGSLLAALVVSTCGASAQSPCPAQPTPNFTAGGNVFGRIAPQWNSYFGMYIYGINGCSYEQTLINPIFSGAIQYTGNFGITGTISTTNTTASTSPTTGAMVDAGGLGVGGAIYTAGLIYATGSIYAAGGLGGSASTTTAVSTGSTTARTLAARFADVANVYDYGAAGNDSTDDTAAIQATVNAAESSGAAINFPHGHFCIKTGPVILPGSTNGLTMSGVNRLSTILDACGQDVSILSVTSYAAKVSNLQIIGSQTLATANPTVELNSGCVNCELDDDYIEGGKYGVYSATAELHINNTQIAYVYGPAMVYITGGGGYIREGKFDQPWPGTCGGTTYNSLTLSARLSSTSYSTGAIVTNNGFVLCAITGGTSGSSAPTNLGYNQNITDGSVTWQIAAPMGSSIISCDTGCGNNLYITHTDMTGASYYGLKFANSLSGTYPSYVILEDDSIGQQLYFAVYDSVGAEDIQILGNTLTDCFVSNCLNVYENGSYWVINGNQIGYAADGIYMAGGVSGANSWSIVGNLMNNLSNDGVFLNITSGNMNLAATGNVISATGNAFQILSGTADHATIVGNITNGSGAFFSNGSSGTHIYSTPGNE